MPSLLACLPGIAAITSGLTLALSAASAHASPSAQDQSAVACDSSAIDWILPGQFATARARAARDGRILIIKGVSFGIDDAGAKCATEGTW